MQEKDAISSVIEELNHIVEGNVLTYKVVTPLAGLKIPEHVNKIKLSKNSAICRLTSSDLKALGAWDVTSPLNPIDISHVFCALVVSFDINLRISGKSGEFKVAHDKPRREAEKILSHVIHALHITKPGVVFPLSSIHSVIPSSFYGLSEIRFDRAMKYPMPEMEMLWSDIDKLVGIFVSLTDGLHSEDVFSATSRLTESEARDSDKDALLDAAIGIEVLLKPYGSGEGYFRIALNYAFLGEPLERRARFDNIREVQKARNDLAHGSAVSSEAESERLRSMTALARKILRDTIQRFLTDESLLIPKKEREAFWINRLFNEKSDWRH